MKSTLRVTISALAIIVPLYCLIGGSPRNDLTPADRQVMLDMTIVGPISVVSRPDGYALVSPGADGVLERELDFDPCLDRSGETEDPDRDIVFCDGQFVQWPAGASQ
jgi:hypothetical protein